ncbi:MAG: hypothetical protein LUM44_21995 [Pyrinomonadaceae bacterium]|nr:hypothetical protein [Pyrinomonadaceae bacterium]
MPNTAQGYCEEFCRSIHPEGFRTGNWFGRLLAFKYQILNFFGTDYSEEEFRTKINDGSIKIISISEPNITNASFGDDINSPGTINGTFAIEAEVDGVKHAATLTFEHEVKWSIHATRTTLS